VTRLRPDRWARIACVALLAALGAAAGADMGAHTDDGCAVELHCIACRSLHSAAPAPTLSAPAVRLLRGASVVSTDAEPRESSSARPSESRGPPLV
jgi:hypothetical protein